MRIQQGSRINLGKWQYKGCEAKDFNPQLVFVFANRFLLEQPKILKEAKALFANADVVFASTAGEVMGTTVRDNTLTFTAIEFEHSHHEIFRVNVLDYDKDSYRAGNALCDQINKNNLKHVFVISEGSNVNGSSLIDGLEKNLSEKIAITGGMCGDDARFERTLAGVNNFPEEGEIIAVGLYGDTLEVSFSNHGGWIPFGPERIVTRSEGNVLFELDNKPALDLYKTYLGDKAAELPQASLFYPLSVKIESKENPLVRTILNIEEDTNAMILAGDIPEKARVQLMMANVDGIVDGAVQAAQQSMNGRKEKPQLAIAVSCIGRKLVMDQRVEEEIEEVSLVIGSDVPITGFYSYGEMAPFAGSRNCELHNQTMTLTLISE